MVPDWVCEVISPSNAAYDRVTKADLYAKCAGPHLWLVDPSQRVLESFVLSGQAWLRVGSFDDSAKARIKPFEDVELEVGALFPPKRPSP